jgi:hypothetical protein
VSKCLPIPRDKSCVKSLLPLIPVYVSALLSCSRVCFFSSLFTVPHYFISCQEFASSHSSLIFRITLLLKSLLLLIPLYICVLLLSCSRVCFFSSLFTFLHYYSLAQEFASSDPSLRFRVTLLLKSLLPLIPQEFASSHPSLHFRITPLLKSLFPLIPLYVSALFSCNPCVTPRPPKPHRPTLL